MPKLKVKLAAKAAKKTSGAKRVAVPTKGKNPPKAEKAAKAEKKKRGGVRPWEEISTEFKKKITAVLKALTTIAESKKLVEDYLPLIMDGIGGSSFAHPESGEMTIMERKSPTGGKTVYFIREKPAGRFF